ncbi:sarcosine oxidase subunit gamma [Paracoccus sp. S-4012]|uniref:sarcosine oxidase subunit gamma n=1 Tax=Paracoccus sp. S-4012 TaxID=2665648 RepID=UPI0012B08435|nr:sarcosine oxidase subunit gamma family protein [Paracoccus sp. S-4012]MRX51227.1 sarcosine oxidase subunit gamma [Paracoccus sp. S-4012]
MAEMTALARVTRVEGLGMVTIRADLDRAGDAIAGASGLPLPGRVGIVAEGDRALGWMSPDELLLMLPHAELADALTDLREALRGEASLVADVSDMRCVFDLTGEDADQVLAKLSPTDLEMFPPGALRRTRLAQVPAAFWRIPGGFRLIAFRSVEVYLRELLETAAAPGTWLDPR